MHRHDIFSHDFTKTSFGKHPIVSGYTTNAVAITENDKLPWPHPYEHTEKEHKWRPIKSNIDGYQQVHVLPINDAASTTSNPLIFPTDINPIPTIINPTSPYHPYSYETVYVTKYFNSSDDSNGSSNAYDAFNDIQNDNNDDLHAKDGLIPAENTDNK